MAILTDYKHIQLDQRGIPKIAGSTMKVIELVMAHLSLGWTAEEIHVNHPDLSLSQIYSALAYYWENKQELDRAIQADLKFAPILRQNTSQSLFVNRLKRQNILN
ncbi:MAG: DUF433 domain-containing protein [Microcystaceae cyanobacterium]